MKISKIIILLILSCIYALPKLNIKGTFNVVFDNNIPKKLPSNIKYAVKEGTFCYENDTTKIKNLVLNPGMFKSLSMSGDGLITFKNPTEFSSMHLSSNFKLFVKGPWFSKSIVFDGDGLIQANNIKMQKIDIELKGKVDVILQGYLNVGTINAKDLAQINLYWVDSNILNINTFDNASINAAGKCNILNANLQDKSSISAHSLRAKYAFIKAKDTTIVKVNPLQELYLKASDFAEIWHTNNQNNTFSLVLDNAVLMSMDLLTN